MEQLPIYGAVSLQALLDFCHRGMFLATLSFVIYLSLGEIESVAGNTVFLDRGFFPI